MGRWPRVKTNSKRIGLERLNRKTNHTSMASIGRRAKLGGRTRVRFLLYYLKGFDEYLRVTTTLLALASNLSVTG